MQFPLSYRLLPYNKWFLLTAEEREPLEGHTVLGIFTTKEKALQYIVTSLHLKADA